MLAQPSLFAREQRTQIDAFELPRFRRPLEPGVREHVFDQMAEAIGLAMKGLEIFRLLILRDHPLGQHLRVHAKGGQRRPKLVGDRGYECRPAFA